MKKLLSLIMTLLLCLPSAPVSAQVGNSVQQPTRAGGRFYASSYGRYQLHTFTNTNVGATSIVLDIGAPNANGASDSGRTLQLFQGPVFPPIQIQDAPETAPGLTVSGASGCGSNASVSSGSLGACILTTSAAANAHGAGALVTSGTFGLQEAINDAFLSGGGTVVIDPSWTALGGTDAVFSSLVPFQGVSIEDARNGTPYLLRLVSNATFMAVPATLTATTVGFGLNGANTTGGAYNGASTYHYCVSYVDLMGNEGPCSLDFSAATAGTGTANQIGFAFPAASPGAVGYVPYISLAGGTYALAYRVPVTSSVCTLTKIETVIAACAVPNTTYGQSGSNAVVSALTVNTARLAAQLGAASTTADIVSNSGAHTVYTYAVGSNSAAVISSYAPFTITTAAATTVPAILGTIQLKAGFMNKVGNTITVCGHATQAAAGSTATVETIQMVWDADGSNTTGAGVIIGNGLNLTSTMVTGNADVYNFCETLRTTVASASVTGCSIQSVGGFLQVEGAQTATSNRAGGDTSVGATGSLNCVGEARIDVQYVHTTGTDANGLVLQNLTVFAN